MKLTYKIIIAAMCFIATLGVIGSGSLLIENNPAENQNTTIPDNPDNEEVIPPGDNLPPPPAPAPTVQYDLLIKIKGSVVYLLRDMNSVSKVVGKVYQNDMLPLIDEFNGFYQTIFNHRIVYVAKNSDVEIAKFEKSDAAVERLIEEAKKLIGVPYLLGAERYHWGNGIKNPNFSKNLFDCSSFTQYVYYISNNVLLDTTSRSQSVQGKYVSKTNIKRGDLMFFTNSVRFDNVGIERIGHVAIYLGNNYIIHTSHDYAIIEPISNTRWSYYITTRRFL